MTVRRRALLGRLLLAALPGALCVAVFAAAGADGAVAFGVQPRVPSLRWLLWPWFHFSWSHVLKNALLLAVIVFMHLRDPVLLAAVWAYGQLVGGLLVWIAGRAGSVHAGASGVANALLASLLMQRLAARRVSLAAAAVAVALLGAAAVAVEAEEGVSSEGHLFGYVCGVVVTAALTWRGQQQQQQQQSVREEIV